MIVNIIHHDFLINIMLKTELLSLSKWLHEYHFKKLKACIHSCIHGQIDLNFLYVIQYIKSL